MRHLSCLVLMSIGAALAAPATLKPTGLRCEYRSNPRGIDETQPRLTWTLEATNPKARGLKQSAYRVLVASSPEGLAAGQYDLWDSGQVESGDSVLVPYRGRRLESGMRAFWRVKVWDQSGSASDWSETAQWSMGFLNASDWQAKWIGRDEKAAYKHAGSPFQLLTAAKWIWFGEGDPAGQPAAPTRWFQAEFRLPAGRAWQHATFVIAADGGFRLLVNGQYAGRGSDVVMPEVLDVAALLKSGDNTIAVQAKGSKNGPAGLIGALRVTFPTGEPVLFSTGALWQAAPAEGGPWSAAKELGPYGMQPWGEVGFLEEHALPARMLRKEFRVGAGLKRATAYVSGLGLSELEVNGVKVGDHVLSPGLTDYNKRVLYVTHDVTKMLAPGQNALGVLLGNGRYFAPREGVPVGTVSFGFPKLLLRLELEYAGGKRAAVVSDETWKLTANGPVRVNNEYDGEEYDARMEMAGWSRGGFNDASWEQARMVAPPPGRMAAQMAEPLKVTETLTPKTVTAIRPGVFIFDMGQNMVGWVRLHVNGARAAQVMLRFSETLRPDGTLYLDNLRSARATDYYTLKGGGPEVWEPRFTYHGFRFVEVTGYPGEPTPASIEGRVVHDAMDRTGEFESSDSLLNRIHHNIYWGIRGNYRSIPTDCPQRDERQGWLGDRSIVSRGESYLFDVAAFYTKWAADLRDSQRESGSIPDVAPAYWAFYNDGIVWPSTFVLASAMLYDQYGDVRVIERGYPAMKKWVEYMRGFLKDGIMPNNTYGDWCVPPEKPELIHSEDPARVTAGPLLSTAYYYRILRLMSRCAKLIGRAEDTREYETLAAQVREAFLKRYFNEQASKFDNGTQTSSVLPLAVGLVPEREQGRVVDSLVKKIETESGNHVGVGLVGAQWLMRTLSDNGRADLAFTIATQNTYPGWGYMVEKGATTIWELWNGDTADPAMNSGNHVMQIGDLGVWMYEYLAGIRPDPETPGFKHFIVKPYPVAALTYVKATHKSPYGLISSSWKRDGGKLTLSVTVPPNTTAAIHVPGRNVTESGGLKIQRAGRDETVFEAGSGMYSFVAR